MKKNRLILFLGVLSSLIIVPIKIYAFCPVCIVATGFLAVILKRMGIDEVIFGVWLGAFTLSTAIFFDTYIKNKIKDFPFRLVLIIFVFYVSTIISLYWSNSINAYSKLWGMNKVFLGLASGSLTLLIGIGINKMLKKTNNDKVFISYQKVIISIAILSLNSLIFYLLIK